MPVETTDFVQVLGLRGQAGIRQSVPAARQYFLVNRRFIRSSYLEHAVRKAYDDLVAQGSILPGSCIEIDPAQIDINIHPTKTGDQFRDDRAVYAIVHAAVPCPGAFHIAPSLDFEPEPALIAAFSGDLRGPPCPSARCRQGLAAA